MNKKITGEYEEALQTFNNSLWKMHDEMSHELL